jgi:predicted transcriptional regulator
MSLFFSIRVFRVISGSILTRIIERKRLAGKVTRQIRLLRAHGLIKKIPKTHRYQLTQSGNQIINAILNAQNANVKKLSKMAA